MKDIPSLPPQAGDLVTSCVVPSAPAFSSQSTLEPALTYHSGWLTINPALVRAGEGRANVTGMKDAAVQHPARTFPLQLICVLFILGEEKLRDTEITRLRRRNDFLDIIRVKIMNQSGALQALQLEGF